MMDLKDYETRELITLGTNQLRNPFIKNFVDVQSYSLKGEVTPFGISFYIAPYINATIRVGTLEEKLLLFESMLDFRGYEQIPSTKRGSKGQFETRVEQACRTCKNVKNRQTRARDYNLSVIENLIEQNNLLNDPILIIQLDEPTEENLTGLIANQIMGKYMRPVLILNHYIEVDKQTGEILVDVWRGSGRNATYSKLKNFREFLTNSNLVEYAEGHANAFGVSIFDKDLNDFKEYVKKELKDFDFSNSYRVDFIWSANEIEQYKNDIMDLGKLENIWGQGLSEPYIVIENIKIHKDNLVLMSPDKKPTLKIILPDNLTLIKFNSSQEEFNNLISAGCIIINAVGTCNLNEGGINIAQITQPLQVQVDIAPLTTTLNSFAKLVNQCSVSFEDICKGLERASKVLTDLGITVYTPEGEYRNLGEVLKEAYDKKEMVEQLRPATSAKTEISNQKESFDFLEQNAYDHIQSIFDPKIEHIVSLDNI